MNPVTPPAFARLRHPGWLLAGLLLLALLWRAPGLLQEELNLDESLYRLIGQSLADGTAPYVAYWDRKPVGTFLITGALQAAFGGSLFAFRALGALVVGLSGWLLALIGGRLFPGLPWAGPLAGLLYVLFSIGNGGAGTNTEHYLTPLGLAGFVLLLRGAGQAGGATARQALLAGLFFGLAIQVKQYALFDSAAFIMIYAMLVLGRQPAGGFWQLRRGFALVGFGVALPLLAVLLWYVAIGRLDIWLQANIAANLETRGGLSLPLNLPGLRLGLRGFDALVLGSALALGLALLRPAGRAAWRGWLALLIWAAFMVIFLWTARRFADHFFLQVLPLLALTTACGLSLLHGWLAGGGAFARRLAGPVLCGLLALAALRVGGGSGSGAVEMLWRRHLAGEAQWGDRTAALAARIGPRVAGQEDILVFGRWLGLHRLTGTRPGGRFPFIEHLWAGYAPVDGPAEIARLLAARPGFIVLESRWLAGPTDPGAAMAGVFAPLQAALARDYVEEARIGPYISWRGGPVGGEVDAVVFRRRDRPGPQG
jgi:hypothetical protein